MDMVDWLLILEERFRLKFKLLDRQEEVYMTQSRNTHLYESLEGVGGNLSRFLGNPKTQTNRFWGNNPSPKYF